MSIVIHSHTIRGLALSLGLSLSLSGCIIAVSPSQPGKPPSSTPTSSPTPTATTIPVGGGPSASPTVGPGPGQVVSPGPTPVATQDPSPNALGFHLIYTGFTAPNLPLSSSSNGVTLSLERTVFRAGETIRLSYSASGAVASNAWIGVIPSNTAHGDEAVNDQSDVDFKYLQSKSSGVLEFNVPQNPGNYDFRFNESDSGGRELASLSFVAIRSLTPDEQGKVSLSLAPGPYQAGKSVTLRFTAPSSFDRNGWIGLFAADKPHGDEQANDQVELTYQYIEGRTSGEMTFNLPTTPGRYDFRMHDRDGGGTEACYFVFDVVP